MTRFRYTAIILFAILFSLEGLAQGRTDKDRVLFDTRETAIKIDNDSLLTRSINRQENQIKFYKGDSLRKLIKLKRIASGTEMTTYYFTDKPILIFVQQNNYPLSDTADISIAINSFINYAHMSHSTSGYVTAFHVAYYFYEDKVRFAAAVIYSDKELVQDVRHDDKNDIAVGMKEYNLAKECILVQQHSLQAN